jgi:hypothetical protein
MGEIRRRDQRDFPCSLAKIFNGIGPDPDPKRGREALKVKGSYWLAKLFLSRISISNSETLQSIE